MDELFIGLYLNQHFDQTQVPEILLSNKEIRIFQGSIDQADQHQKYDFTLSLLESAHQLENLNRFNTDIHLIIIPQNLEFDQTKLPSHALIYFFNEDEPLNEVLRLIYNGILVFLVCDEYTHTDLEPVDFKYLASEGFSEIKIIKYDLNNVLSDQFHLEYELHHHLTHSNTTIVNFLLQDCCEISTLRRALMNLFSQIKLDQDHQLFYGHRVLEPRPDLSAQPEYVYLIYQRN